MSALQVYVRDTLDCYTRALHKAEQAGLLDTHFRNFEYDVFEIITTSTGDEHGDMQVIHRIPLVDMHVHRPVFMFDSSVNVLSKLDIGATHVYYCGELHVMIPTYDELKAQVAHLQSTAEKLALELKAKDETIAKQRALNLRYLKHVKSVEPKVRRAPTLYSAIST